MTTKNPETKPCPSCGATMTKDHGTVTERVVSGYGEVSKRARPVTAYGCSACEHCEEV